VCRVCRCWRLSFFLQTIFNNHKDEQHRLALCSAGRTDNILLDRLIAAGTGLANVPPFLFPDRPKNPCCAPG
jgi:hypothetical protein